MKKLTAMIEDRYTGEFFCVTVTLEKGYNRLHAKRDFGQLGTVHKIVEKVYEPDNKEKQL